jgi:hypothetical protein
VPITFNCSCGKTLRVPDANAGKRAKCPACNAVVPIPVPAPPPEPEPVFEVVEEEPPAAVPPPLPPYHRPVVDDDSDDGGTYGIAAPEKTDPVTGEEPRVKKLPNFRRGGENYK